MNEIITHIEFLILQHEYVIIPDLGGFVLSREHSSISEDNTTINPPGLTLGFNSDLKFNDGLLAASYMKSNNATYESACKTIENEVKRIKSLLVSGESVDFGSLGSLKMMENHILFQPASKRFMNHPGVWGYAPINIPLVKDIAVPYPHKATRYKFKLKYISIGVASAVAMLALFILPGIIDDGYITPFQQSGFLSNTNTELVKNVVKTKRVFISDYINENKELFLKSNPDTGINNKDYNLIHNSQYYNPDNKGYYVIVGGDTKRSKAESLLSNIRAKGFVNAGIVESPERSRVYVSAFSDNDKAYEYLMSLRKQYPSDHADAWVYVKK